MAYYLVNILFDCLRVKNSVMRHVAAVIEFFGIAEVLDSRQMRFEYYYVTLFEHKILMVEINKGVNASCDIQ